MAGGIYKGPGKLRSLLDTSVMVDTPNRNLDEHPDG